MKNLENIKLVLKKIEENPDCWNQETWHCGTTHCFAGHAQIEAGKAINSNTTRTDARIFFGFTKKEADYYFDAERTLEELKTAAEDFHDGNGLARFGNDGFDYGGFDRDGYDCDGFNESGYSRDGYDRDGYDSDGFNHDGIDSDGFDFDELDKDNNPKPE